MRALPSVRCIAFLVLVAGLMLVAPHSLAAPARTLEIDILAKLRQPREEGRPIVIPDLNLGDRRVTIELEPMEIWAADAKIRVWRPTGIPAEMPIPEYENYKGRIVGSDESMVYLSLRKGRLVGSMIDGARKYVIGTAFPVRNRPPRYADPNFDLSNERLPVLIAELDDMDSIGDPEQNWTCAVDQQSTTYERPAVIEPRGLRAVAEAGGVAGASYSLRIALDTDNELCAGFGNDATAITNYMNDLIAKSNIIYERDVKTTLVIGSLEIRNGGAGTDPWTASDNTFNALLEFGTYWHNTPPAGTTPRSAVSLLSGKAFFGGIAWTDVLCETDFYCGDSGEFCGSGTAGKYGGPYSVVGSLSSVSTTNADPTTTIDGKEFAMPNANNFWILAAFTHELGHTIGSKHTNCYPAGGFTAQQKTDYGIGTTSLPDRSFVDTCLNQGTNCYNGVSTTFPTEWGTIMSYCHNHSDGGFRASRYIFGKAGEASELILPVFTAGVDAATPNGTITIGGAPIACSAGQSASVPNAANRTYAWQIVGGTITSATNTSSITYTPSSPSVTVTVTVTNTSSNHGCSITTSATRTTTCEAITAPTNLVATATTTANVLVTWNAVGGATSYKVFRSSNGSTYTQVGSPATNSFNDSSVAAGRSYLYKVRANDGLSDSGDSNVDLATTVIFTDPTLTQFSTTVKAAHISELRTAVNAVRALAGSGAAVFTDPTLTGGVSIAKAIHATELRLSLDAARTALGLSALSYTDPTVTGGSTLVKAAHVNELRDGVR